MSKNLASKVNTFIGTKAEGNTFPGASAPFGMIQVSPIGRHFAGWREGDGIKGMGHSFVSGAGCWSQGGQLSVLPTLGEVGPGKKFDTSKADTFNHDNYKSSYSTKAGDHTGQAGYYSVKLVQYNNTRIEATALTRTGAERYTFPGSSTSEPANVFINVGQANGEGDQRNSVKNVMFRSSTRAP